MVFECRRRWITAWFVYVFVEEKARNLRWCLIIDRSTWRSWEEVSLLIVSFVVVDFLRQKMFSLSAGGLLHDCLSYYWVSAFNKLLTSLDSGTSGFMRLKESRLKPSCHVFDEPRQTFASKILF